MSSTPEHSVKSSTPPNGRNRGRARGHSRGGVRGRGSARGRGHGRKQRTTHVDITQERVPASEETPTPPKPETKLGQNSAKPSRKFGSKLTNIPSSAVVSTQPPAPIREYSDLRMRLIAELSHDEYDCTICYNTIKRKHPIWSCERCYSVLHLTCIKTWAERSVAQVEEQNAMHQDTSVREAKGHWRCPGCQDVKREIPRTYRCWCGRVANPHPPAHATPHSCGAPCQRGCKRHGCPADKCHPGPCPPCAATVAVPCFCGKEQHMHVRCSQLPPNDGPISCGRECGKPLACGHHTCTQPCHDGECAPCAVRLVDVPCFCGRHTRTMTCGERAPEAAGLTSAWSCNEPCNTPFACGHHTCQKPCHIRTGIARCPYAPEQVKTCPCGRTRLLDRTDCRDPIPTCDHMCGKRHSACGHACTAKCHAGECPPCTESVLQVCRCGNSKRRIACHDVATAPFLCESVCKVTRHCGKHVCHERCCPLAYQATIPKKMLPTDMEQLDPMRYHVCHVQCQKMLSCGRHRCEAPCHRGACSPCLRSTFTEVACTCGRTVLEPPVPCGTQVECSYPCSLPPPPCGHPKIPHSCHPADTPCPPCVHLTSKPCMCGRTTLEAVPCSRKQVRCALPCRALLACGQHKCPGTCHAEGECAPCTQVCGRPRPMCGHPCERKCHAPEPCDVNEPCRAVVLRRCECGHREQLDVCGAAPGVERKPAPPLECTPACKVAQRNARFAQALGLDAQHREETTYDAALVQHVAIDPRGAQIVQDVLNEFVQSPRMTSQLRMLLVSYVARRQCEPIKVNTALLVFTEKLARTYHLDAELCTPEGLLFSGTPPPGGQGVDVRVKRTRDTRIPVVSLTEYASTQPARASLEARRTRTAAQPTKPVANAVWMEGTRDEAEDAALAAALQPATLNGKRSWTLVHTNAGTVFTNIRLEPQSLAAIAGRPKPRGADVLSLPSERRLLWLCEDVKHALNSAGATACVAPCAWTHGCISHIFRDGRWEST